MGIRNTNFRPPRRTNPRKGRLCLAPMPPDEREERIPPPAQSISTRGWQRERVQRLARIFRCLDRGQAKGRRLHERLVRFAWKWNGRRYKGEPARRFRLAKGTLRNLYRRWKASGGNPASLALHYRAPVKLRPGLALDFARVCISSDVRSFTEAHGRLPRPVATWFAYRLALPASLRRRIVWLFAARRLVNCRALNGRAAVNAIARKGAG
jgi:hypothetical protein